MGYLSQGNHIAFFVRLNDAGMAETNRLLAIFRKTKKKRIKRKIAKRIDSLVPISKASE